MGTGSSKSTSNYQQLNRYKKPKRDWFNRTEAMRWIEAKKTEPPIEMQHDPEMHTTTGWTCAMYWTESVKTDPPEWMRHKPYLQTLITHAYDNPTKDRTCAMLWVQNVGTNPPEWMHHHPLWTDQYDRTIRMYWLNYVDNNPPEWMTITHKKKESEDPNQT